MADQPAEAKADREPEDTLQLAEHGPCGTDDAIGRVGVVPSDGFG